MSRHRDLDEERQIAAIRAFFDASREPASSDDDDGAVDVRELVVSAASSGSGLTGRARVLVERRPAVAFAVTAVIAAAIAAVLTWLGRPVPVPVASTATTMDRSPPAVSSAAEPTPTTIVVSVVGMVHQPGLITLPDGARVADAISAAGGALDGVDLTTLNLARRLVDGEQVAVGVPPPLDAPPPGSDGSGAPGTSSKVNLNTATLAELDELPGVGPVLAQRIVDYRTKNGPFESVAQLDEVSGVGPAMMANLADLVTV